MGLSSLLGDKFSRRSCLSGVSELSIICSRSEKQQEAQWNPGSLLPPPLSFQPADFNTRGRLLCPTLAYSKCRVVTLPRKTAPASLTGRDCVLHHYSLKGVQLENCILFPL